MITPTDYFGKFIQHKDATPAVHMAANRLLNAVNLLMSMAEADGVKFPINPVTHSQVSGAKYGGFRPRECSIGAGRSAHKTAEAVDIYDPDDEIDKWCLSNTDKLEEVGIYLEHPDYTVGWSHWSIRRPKSGNRVFYP